MHFAQFLTGLQLMVFFSCHETKWSALFKYCVMICCFRNWLQLDECRTNLIFVSTDGTQQLHCPKWVHCESSHNYSLLRCTLRKHFGVFIFRLAAASCRNEIEDICSLQYFCKISITVNYFNKQYTRMKFQCMLCALKSSTFKPEMNKKVTAHRNDANHGQYFHGIYFWIDLSVGVVSFVVGILSNGTVEHHTD